jgi:hypothetical protein
MWERQKKYGQWEKRLKEVVYHEFVAVIGKVRIKVIVKTITRGATSHNVYYATMRLEFAYSVGYDFCMKEFPQSEFADKQVREAFSDTERPPRNEAEHQVRLAMELYTRDHPSAAAHVGETRVDNAAGFYWIKNGFAEAFRKFVRHPDFREKKNFRLNGNYANITLSDVEYFLHNHELPER